MNEKDYKIADLTHEEMMKLDQMEHDLGLTLIAYENTDEQPKNETSEG